MSKLNYLYLGLGSNLGDKIENILLAYTQIQERIGCIKNKSFVYETPPWGFKSKDVFYNTALLVETKLNAIEVLKIIKEIERELGRDTAYKVGYSSRVIDIDILDFNGEIMSSVELTIPHPHIENRDFVLYPLRDVNNSWIHPVSSDSIQRMIEEIGNQNEIKIVIF